MGASLRAELLILRKWPAVWVLVLLGPFLTFLFDYFLPYFNYLSVKSGTAYSEVSPGQLLVYLLPKELLVNVMDGFALYGSAVAIILAALVAGGEHGRGTLKTSLTQRPGRLATYTGQMLALAVALVVIALGTLIVGAACAFAISLAEGEASSLPATAEIIEAIGRMLLVTVSWAAVGLALGVLFRGAGLAIGAGLVWITVQALMETVALQAGGILQIVYEALPAANTVAVTGVFNTSASPTADPLVAPWVLAAYALVSLAFGAFLVLRRDVG